MKYANRGVNYLKQYTITAKDHMTNFTANRIRFPVRSVDLVENGSVSRGFELSAFYTIEGLPTSPHLARPHSYDRVNSRFAFLREFDPISLHPSDSIPYFAFEFAEEVLRSSNPAGIKICPSAFNAFYCLASVLTAKINPDRRQDQGRLPPLCRSQ